jgi:disulfide bond formation protein DsbB
MYPLVLVFLINLLYPDNHILKYSLPIVITGWLISLYHNLLMFEIISEDLSPCVQGVPCSTKYIDWFGFINIPLLSFTAFSIIFILLFLTRKEIIKNEK